MELAIEAPTARPAGRSLVESIEMREWINGAMKGSMHDETLLSNSNAMTTPAARPVGWGAIFAGTLTAVGVWLLLHLLGVSVGLVAIDPDNPSTLRAIGIGTGVWALIAPLLALFVGGLAAGRLAGPLTRLTGAIHGMVVWSLTTVTAMVLVGLAAGSLLGAIGAAGSGAANQASVAGLGSLEALGLSADDLLAPINQRLQAEGRPPVRSDQLGAVAQDVLRRAVREGQFDRDVLVTSLAQNTALSPADANALAGTVERRFQERAGQVRRAALGAAEATGKAMLGLFFVMLLGLLGAVVGATLSVRHEQRRDHDSAGRMPRPIVAH